MSLEELRNDISLKQKKGLPFIMTSVVIWTLISIVSLIDIPVSTKNMLVFCCSAVLMPISMLIAKIIKVNIFSKENPLGNLGFLFTMNQMLYLLIVMWVFTAVPEKWLWYMRWYSVLTCFRILGCINQKHIWCLQSQYHLLH